MRNEVYDELAFKTTLISNTTIRNNNLFVKNDKSPTQLTACERKKKIVKVLSILIAIIRNKILTTFEVFYIDLVEC